MVKNTRDQIKMAGIVTFYSVYYNNNNNNTIRLIIVKTNRSTLHTVYNIQHYNSLPYTAAMTRHTDCHAGQQQQPGLAQSV